MYQEEFIDVNFSVLVYVNFTQNFMKLVLCYVLSSFLSNISPVLDAWFCIISIATDYNNDSFI